MEVKSVEEWVSLKIRSKVPEGLALALSVWIPGVRMGDQTGMCGLGCLLSEGGR